MLVGTALERLLCFLFQALPVPLAWSIRSVCLLAPGPARVCTSMQCVGSSVWMGAAALVINFPFYLQTRDPASALGFGKGDEGHLCLFLLAEIRRLLFRF